MPTRSTIVRTGLGLLLLATAALKLYGLSASPVPQIGWFSQPRVQLLAAEWELVLGAWLLSGIAPRASWAAAVGTFVAFAGVSGYLGWQGVASCGCLGAVPASPWWVFGIDAAAVAALAVSRPKVDEQSEPRFRAAGVWVSSVALLCAVLVGVGAATFGSVEVAVAKLRGETLTADAAFIDMGSGKPGETLTATATVANWTGRPVRILGGTADCSCITTDDFPLVIPPNSKASFRIRMKVLSDASGHVSRTISIRTDHADRPQLVFRLGCEVTD